MAFPDSSATQCWEPYGSMQVPSPELDPAGHEGAHLVYLSMSAGSIHCLDSGLLAASVACLACTAFSLSTSLFLQVTGGRLATLASNPVPGADRLLKLSGELNSSACNLLLELHTTDRGGQDNGAAAWLMVQGWGC